MTSSDRQLAQAATLAVAATLALLTLAACGGGGGPTSMLPPGDGGGSTGGESLSDLPVVTQIEAARPEALHRAAGASPRFGSVSQGSNVSNGVTADRVSISYIRDTDGFHPAATFRTGDGAVLSTNTNPRSVDVVLPAWRIVRMTVDGPDQGNVPYDEIERLYTPADWKAAEEEEYRYLVMEYGETEAREMFVDQYGAYPIPDSVPYDSGSRPFSYSTFEQWVSPPGNRRHPKGRAVNEVYLSDVLDDSVRGPGHYTSVHVLALTDYPAAVVAGTDDYLTWGSWLYYTTTPTDLDFVYGAFADGEETATNDIPVAGSASYAGLTQALAIRGGTPSRVNLDDDAYWNDRVAFLRGEVNLQANFASSSVTGSVGRLRAFALQGSDELAGYFPSNVTIDLGTAPIEAGTFEGDARATSGLPSAVGKWGGQFFGTPAAGAAPPAAGGTWGVTQGTGDNDWKVVGGFGSWRE